MSNTFAPALVERILANHMREHPDIAKTLYDQVVSANPGDCLNTNYTDLTPLAKWVEKFFASFGFDTEHLIRQDDGEIWQLWSDIQYTLRNHK